MPYIDPEVARRESARRMREMRARRAANRSERVHIPAAAPDVAVVRAVHSWLDGRRSHGIAEMIGQRPEQFVSHYVVVGVKRRPFVGQELIDGIGLPEIAAR